MKTMKEKIAFIEGLEVFEQFANGSQIEEQYEKILKGFKLEFGIKDKCPTCGK